jgi:preprotein translocase subunit SecY
MPQAHQASSAQWSCRLGRCRRESRGTPQQDQAYGFTLAALVVYRLGTYVPIPGISGQPLYLLI